MSPDSRGNCADCLRFAGTPDQVHSGNGHQGRAAGPRTRGPQLGYQDPTEVGRRFATPSVRSAIPEPLFDIVANVRPRPTRGGIVFVGFESFLNDAQVPLWDWNTLGARGNPVPQGLDIVDLFVTWKALKSRWWHWGYLGHSLCSRDEMYNVTNQTSNGAGLTRYWDSGVSPTLSKVVTVFAWVRFVSLPDLLGLEQNGEQIHG